MKKRASYFAVDKVRGVKNPRVAALDLYDGVVAYRLKPPGKGASLDPFKEFKELAKTLGLRSGKALELFYAVCDDIGIEPSQVGVETDE